MTRWPTPSPFHRASDVASLEVRSLAHRAGQEACGDTTALDGLLAGPSDGSEALHSVMLSHFRWVQILKEDVTVTPKWLERAGRHGARAR